MSICSIQSPRRHWNTVGHFRRSTRPRLACISRSCCRSWPRSNRFSLVRSNVNFDGNHRPAGSIALTGAVASAAGFPPNFGSILARQRGSGSLPAFVSLVARPHRRWRRTGIGFWRRGMGQGTRSVHGGLFGTRASRRPRAKTSRWPHAGTACRPASRIARAG